MSTNSNNRLQETLNADQMTTDLIIKQTSTTQTETWAEENNILSNSDNILRTKTEMIGFDSAESFWG